VARPLLRPADRGLHGSGGVVRDRAILAGRRGRLLDGRLRVLLLAPRPGRFVRGLPGVLGLLQRPAQGPAWAITAIASAYASPAVSRRSSTNSGESSSPATTARLTSREGSMSPAG
jgi:hypothetical protein